MRIGTRDSRLAMRQTEIFAERLKAFRPDVRYEVVGMKAAGDLDLASPLNGMEGTGAFVRELDDALLRGDIDLSVNSLKDIPVMPSEGISVGAVLPRDAPEDVMLPCSPEELPEGASVGTGSVRRAALIREIRPDVRTVGIRGNIHTRLEKLDSGKYDAIILAKAGLDRMGIDRQMHVLDPSVFLPAPAQGAIAVECRSDDRDILELLHCTDDYRTRTETGLERAIMRFMAAGCSSPVGVHATTRRDGFGVRAVSFSCPDGPRRVDAVLPFNHVVDDLLDIADYLTGKRC